MLNFIDEIKKMNKHLIKPSIISNDLQNPSPRNLNNNHEINQIFYEKKYFDDKRSIYTSFNSPNLNKIEKSQIFKDQKQSTISFSLQEDDTTSIQKNIKTKPLRKKKNFTLTKSKGINKEKILQLEKLNLFDNKIFNFNFEERDFDKEYKNAIIKDLQDIIYKKYSIERKNILEVKNLSIKKNYQMKMIF